MRSLRLLLVILTFSAGVLAADSPFSGSSYEAKFDGKEYPIVGDPDSDSVSLHRANERDIKFTIKKAGTVVSKLGRCRFQRWTDHYTNYIQGKQDKSSAVYDKQ